MKKKLLAGLLLATLAIGTLSPTSSEAAAKKATKTKTQTKIDGVAIKDLIAGKYDDISTVKTKIEKDRIQYTGTKKEKIFFTDYVVEEGKYDYKSDKLIWDIDYPIQKRAYGKDYKDKTIDYGDGYIDTYTDGDIDKYIFESLPYYRYNYKNVLKAENSRLYFDTVITLGSREEEVAEWKLDPSCFKTTKAKLTDDEIIIKGTYTFSVKKIRGKVNLYSEKKYIEGYNFDRDFFSNIGKEDHLKIHKNVKCNATAIFYRDTKQLKSLELKAKLPKKGYYLNQFKSEAIALYNASYTFEHRWTEAQKAERISKITEEDMIEGKANKFEDIEYDFTGTVGGARRVKWFSVNGQSGTISDNYIEGFYIDMAYNVGDKQFSTGFDLSRFNITSSETEEDVIIITGVYKIKTDSNTIYDKYAEKILNNRDSIYCDWDDLTADVTIVFNSKTKSMEKVTLKYNPNNIIAIDEYSEYINPGSIVCSTIYTFINN